MSDDTTGKSSGAEPETDWNRLRDMTDDEVHAAIVDDPEVNPTNDAFWKTARAVRGAPNSAGTRRGPAMLKFRDDIHFDPQSDDAVIWGDEGKRHFRLAIRRRLLEEKYGLKKHFDHATAEALVKEHREAFERLAQHAYETGASELVVG
jgi:hypothetical protein